MKVKLAAPWFAPSDSTGGPLNRSSGQLFSKGVVDIDPQWRNMLPSNTVFLDPEPEPDPKPDPKHKTKHKPETCIMPEAKPYKANK